MRIGESRVIASSFLVTSALILIIACSSARFDNTQPLAEASVFMAEGIDNPRVQFVWLEIPKPLRTGMIPVRLFLARTEPPEPTIPNPTDLRCKLSTQNEYAMLGPEQMLFDFKQDSTFSGSYTYKACPECIECYMNWDYTLEITGSVSEESASLDIAVIHFGHNVRGSFLRTDLGLAKNPNKEPSIQCNREIECRDIKFISRKRLLLCNSGAMK